MKPMKFSIRIGIGVHRVVYDFTTVTSLVNIILLCILVKFINALSVQSLILGFQILRMHRQRGWTILYFLIILNQRN